MSRILSYDLLYKSVDTFLVDYSRFFISNCVFISFIKVAEEKQNRQMYNLMLFCRTYIAKFEILAEYLQ